jgi:hypothetical protein
MAGTPKKRARQLAAETLKNAAATLEATAAGETTVADATVLPEGARARARVGIRGTPSDTAAARMPPPVKPAAGQRTREAVDRSQVSVMTKLAQQLKPGLTVRIERLRPHWCAGWLEDYPLEDPDAMGEFYTYLREEHGGQYYRLTVLGAGEQQLYQAQVPISERPKDRGRFIDRAAYEGQQQPRTSNATTQAAPAPAPGTGFGDMLAAATGFIQLILAQSEKTNAATLQSVQTMVEANQRQTSELASAVLQVRSDSRPASFGEQLGEILDATRSLDTVRKALGGTQRAGAAQRGDDDDDDMRLLTREAKRAFLTNAMSGMFQRAPQKRPGGAPAPVGPVAPVTQIRKQNQPVVMDAIPVAGQRPGKN